LHMREDTAEEDKSRVKSYWEHTDELVKRLKVVLYTLVFSTVAMMVLPANLAFFQNPFQSYEPLVGVILKGIREQILSEDIRLIGLKLTVPIELYILASFIFGVAITIPVFAYEVGRFIEPALYQHEKRQVYPFVASVSILFLVGAVFSYTVLMPHVILGIFPFFSLVGAEPVISVMDFYKVVFTFVLVVGSVFTFPAFFVLLVKFGIIGTKLFTKNRRYLYAALFIFAMVLTPDGGFPFGNLIIWIPMILLMEIGFLVARHYEKEGESRVERWFSGGSSCKFCGKSMSADTVFCPNCGKSQK
jgi:sec-independent protein translocase protein TatC